MALAGGDMDSAPLEELDSLEQLERQLREEDGGEELGVRSPLDKGPADRSSGAEAEIEH
jgi:hypothetical protein